MNELMELINSYAVLTDIKTWLMEMSLWNIGGLVFILWNLWSTSLTVTIDGNERSMPKHIITGATLCLMVLFPANMLFACIPYTLVIILLITYQRPVFWYLNLFMPAGRKLSY